MRPPVWAWRLLMAQLARRDLRRVNRDPLQNVDYERDIDYVGDGLDAHRLDVLAPSERSSGADPLPVYVYFHGGGWTSGDKGALTRYCASQAAEGMVVVNVNYRKATLMRHILEDAAASLAWVSSEIARFGGDPQRIVLGGDSAGGQIAALLAAAAGNDELVEHYGIGPVASVRGLVQHCSAVDFSVILERGFIMSLGFIKMLLPARGRGLILSEAIRFLSPIEWIGPTFPPVFVTTSEQDFFFRANMNFLARLQTAGILFETLIYNSTVRNARHTWQQDPHLAESQEVYERLRTFIMRVTVPKPVAG